MIPTKAEETQALEKIKKILSGLGNNPDNSYVCRAFDGCVEDAEDNIQNDFAGSWKERAQEKEKVIEKLEAQRDGLLAEKKEQDAELSELRGMVLNRDTLLDLKFLAERDARVQGERMKAASEIILTNLTQTGSPEFANASSEYMCAEEYKNSDYRILEIVNSLLTGGCAYVPGGGPEMGD